MKNGFSNTIKIFTVCFRYISESSSYNFDNNVIHRNFNIILLCNQGTNKEYITLKKKNMTKCISFDTSITSTTKALSHYLRITSHTGPLKFISGTYL